MENVNILIGRFQPFTNGHLKCCEQIFNETGNRTVVLAVNTKKKDSKHPFTTDILWRDMQKLKGPLIADVLLVKNADIVENAELCMRNGYNPVTWTCGSDRFEAYSAMSERYREKAGLDSDFRVVEIDRTDDDISATKVRMHILANRQSQFEALTPKCFHHLYYKLKKELEELQ